MKPPVKWWKILIIVIGGILLFYIPIIGIPIIIAGILTLTVKKKPDNGDMPQNQPTYTAPTTQNTYIPQAPTTPSRPKFMPKKTDLNSEEINALEIANKSASELAIKTLCDDIDNGAEVQKLYVYMSYNKYDYLRLLDFPFFIYNEAEYESYEKFHNKSADDIYWACINSKFRTKSPAKCQYWKNKLIELAESGDFEAQAKLICCNPEDESSPFSEEVEIFKQKYQINLVALAQQGNMDALYALALNYDAKKEEAALRDIITKTNGTHTDACYTYAQKLGFFESYDENGNYSRIKAAECAYGTPRFAELAKESYKWYCKGADAANGKHTIECQYLAATWAEDELIQDYETAKKYANACLAMTATCPAELKAQKMAKSTLESIEKYHSS